MITEHFYLTLKCNNYTDFLFIYIEVNQVNNSFSNQGIGDLKSTKFYTKNGIKI